MKLSSRYYAIVLSAKRKSNSFSKHKLLQQGLSEIHRNIIIIMRKLENKTTAGAN